MSSRWNHPETMRDLRRVVVRYRHRFVLVFFAVTTGVLLVGLCLPRRYEARAVFERRNDLVLSEIAGRGAPQSFHVLKRSLAEELKSTPAVEKVIDDLDLAPRPTDDMAKAQRRERQLARHDLLTDIQRNLVVRFDISTRDLDRVWVSYIGQDPRVTRRVANQLVANYIENTRSQIDRMLTQAAAFFDQQADEARTRINELEDRRLRFEVEHAGLLPSEHTSVQESLVLAEEDLVMLERRDASLAGRIGKLEDNLAAMDGDEPARIIRGANPDFDRAERELHRCEQQLEQAVVIDKMTGRHPKVQALRQQITSLRDELRRMPREVVVQRVFGENAKRNGMELALLEARNQRESVQAELTAAQKKVARLRAQVAQFFPVRTEYRKIERQIADAQSKVAFWQANQRRVTVALAAERGQRGISLDFVSPCGPISRPTAPNLTQIMFAALALGLLASVAGVLWADRTDQTIHSLDQANRALSVPVIGAVGQIITRRQAALRRWYHRVVAPVSVGAMVMLMVTAAYLNYVSLNRPPIFETSGDPAAAQAPDLPSILSLSWTDPAGGDADRLRTED